jgi:hypothetical protein
MMDTSTIGSIHEGESSSYSSASTHANQLNGQADRSPLAVALSTAAALVAAATASSTVPSLPQTHRQQEHQLQAVQYHRPPTPATVAPIISSDPIAPAPATLSQIMVPTAISFAYPQGQSLPEPMLMQCSAPLHIINGLHESLGFPPITAVKMNTQIPPVFLYHKLRSGKWAPEEETYADLLIELFEKGHINENNGCTLRSFLARKLHCAPMRISKKFAGKGIGRMIFLSKTTNDVGFEEIGSPSYDVNIARLRDAETRFYRAIFPDATRVSILPCVSLPLLYCPPPVLF